MPDTGATATLELPAERLFVRTLDRVTTHAAHVEGVRRHEIQSGDWIVVRTRNSTYVLAVGDGGKFTVTGGWFDRERGAAAIVGVLGCTWGGHAILTTMIAAPGMHLEFTNGVRTTRIREVRAVRGGASSRLH